MYSKKKSTQFWKQISSGLRTPLNVIKGTADIAQNEIYDIETVKEGFSRIEESTDFLLNVVNDIVDYVSIENQDLKLEESPFDLNDLIGQFLAKYFNMARREGKYLDTQVHNVIHEHLIGDRARVEQILECMLYHSIRYTDEGDKLSFRIYETGVSGGQAFFRFTLTGTNGLIYGRLNGTVNGKIVTETTDLSLYNCHYILQQMGGTICVEEKTAGCSEIIIDMPLGIEKEKDRAETEALFAQERVLILCDSREEAEERGSMLSEMHVAYETATTQDEALDLVGAAQESGTPISIFVVDWNVKNTNVKDLIQETHSIFGREIPIVAMAYNVEKREEEARRLGFDAVMTRTWFRSAILNTLMKKHSGTLKGYEAADQKKKYHFEKKRILVAEDAEANRDVIVKILTNVGADVICAENGIEAYNIFCQKPERYFDCILMDINMPEMDGYEATEKIRKSGRRYSANVPIFALTANAFYSDVREALAVGMDGHFSKPIDVNRLYETLEKVFEDVASGTYYYKSALLEQDDEEAQSSKRLTDAETGLMNLHGYEKRMEQEKHLSDPCAFLFLEAEPAPETGTAEEKQMMKQMADWLRKNFRSTDLVFRYGEYCFGVFIRQPGSHLSFLETKVMECASLLGCKIYGGAAYSRYGFFRRITSLAIAALNEQKRDGKTGCCLLEDDKKPEHKELCTGEEHVQRVFGTELIYLRENKLFQTELTETMMSKILGNNQTVGILCGSYDEKLPIRFISSHALENLGYTEESFQRETGGFFENILYSEDVEEMHRHWEDLESVTVQLRCRHRNGDILWFHAVYVTVEGEMGERLWIASFRSIDDNVVSMLCDVDFRMVSVIYPEENTVLFEKGAETVSKEKLKLRKKYNYESLMKNVLSKMHREEEREEYLYHTSLSTLKAQIEKKGIYEFISYRRQDEGVYIPVRYKYRYADNNGKMILWTQEYVENFAERDDVTSLLNANGFYRDLEQTIARDKEQKKEYYILYVNIKDFKSWNELLGYANGDALLRRCAEMIEESALKPICGARFRADRYCFLVEKENMDPDELVRLCHSRVNIAGSTINIHLSCGLYLIEDRNQNAAVMCDKAVIAESNIANEYAAPYYIYDEAVEERYQNQVFVLNNLDRAFEKQEFRVYFQPVCDAKTGRVVAAESLIRWVMPGGKIVSPGVFIPVLERKGYISRLDLYVADRVQNLIRSRVEDGQHAVPISINLSRMDFLNEEFLEDLRYRIDHVGIDQSYFCYEVTESAYIHIPEEGKALLEDVRSRGAKIYLDDFGTGYSSLQNLMETQFNTLKLDMSFIRKIGQNKMAESIIEMTIALSHSLGCQVIAEGVETKEQHQFLLEKGCDLIQGYYFYRPMPLQDFVELLNREGENG